MLKSKAVRVAALALITSAVATGGYALAADIVVSLTATGPQPGAVTANLGDTLTFVNNGTVPYVVASSRLGVTSPSLPPGGSFTHVVTRSGSFPYNQIQNRQTRFAGRIEVQRNAKLTLVASRRSISYGTEITLSGTTSLPAFPVVLEQAAGRRNWVQLASLTPGPDGSFSMAVKPKAAATYRARALGNELQAEAVSIVVRPVVTLRSNARKTKTGRTVTLTLRVVPATAAQSIEIKRYDKERVEWRRLITRPLTTAGVATYKYRVPYGRSLLRGWLTKKNLRGGFAEVFSAQILIQGIGKPPEPPKRERKGRGKRGQRSD